jgi:hypothetical protein
VKSEKLFDAIGMIDDEFIAEANKSEIIDIIPLRDRRKNLFLPKTLIASCVAFLLITTTAFAFNTEFREYIISFFKSGQVETPPSTSGNPDISSPIVIGNQNISSVADVHYFQFANRFTLLSDIVITKGDNGQTEYYSISGQKKINLTPQSIQTKIEYQGSEFDLNFSYVIQDGKIKILENNRQPASALDATAMNSSSSEFVWVNLAKRFAFETYIKYNLKTGKVTDVLSDAGIQINDSTITDFSPDRKKLLISGDKLAVLNIETGKTIELTSLWTEKSDTSVSWIDSDTLSIWEKTATDDTRYNIYTYNLTSHVMTPILENTAQYIPNSSQATGVYGLGRGIILLVEENQYVIIDSKINTRYVLDELKPNKDFSFLLSPDGKKIAVTTITGQNGLGITQIGYINLQEKTFKTFDRKDFDKNYETSMGWIDNNSLAILAQGENQLLYVYTFH